MQPIKIKVSESGLEGKLHIADMDYSDNMHPEYALTTPQDPGAVIWVEPEPVWQVKSKDSPTWVNCHIEPTIVGNEYEKRRCYHPQPEEAKLDEGEKEKKVTLNRNEQSFITDALNFFWHDANKNLKRNDLGDIERKNYEYQLSEAKRLQYVIDPNL